MHDDADKQLFQKETRDDEEAEETDEAGDEDAKPAGDA